MNAHSKTPREALYLEFGLIPFRFHLHKKRISYLRTILQRQDYELTRQIVLLQRDFPTTGDFYQQCLESLETLSLPIDAIVNTVSNTKFKDIVRDAASHASFER